MDRWHSVAEEKIREAMDRGHFSRLRGEGRPLDLRRNPYEPPELHMAHTVLEAAGMCPAWMDERKEIDRAVAAARARLAAGDVEGFRAAARDLNQRILSYNLQVPAGIFQRDQVDVEFEIRRAQRAPR